MLPPMPLLPVSLLLFCIHTTATAQMMGMDGAPVVGAFGPGAANLNPQSTQSMGFPSQAAMPQQMGFPSQQMNGMPQQMTGMPSQTGMPQDDMDLFGMPPFNDAMANAAGGNAFLDTPTPTTTATATATSTTTTATSTATSTATETALLSPKDIQFDRRIRVEGTVLLKPANMDQYRPSDLQAVYEKYAARMIDVFDYILLKRDFLSQDVVLDNPHPDSSMLAEDDDTRLLGIFGGSKKPKKQKATVKPTTTRIAPKGSTVLESDKHIIRVARALFIRGSGPGHRRRVQLCVDEGDGIYARFDYVNPRLVVKVKCDSVDELYPEEAVWKEVQDARPAKRRATLGAMVI